MRLTPVGKIVALILIVGLVIAGYRLFTGTQSGAALLAKVAPGAKTKEAAVPTKADLPSAPTSQDSDEGPSVPSSVPVVGAAPGAANKPEVRMLVWAWNAQMGLMYANGGPQAAQGSIMAKRGVNLKLERQDMVDKMQEALIAFATDYAKGNKNTKQGCHFVAIMGDGAPAFFNGLNPQLERIGPEYRAKVVAIAGYSRGEDKFMGPRTWKDNPSAAMGGVVAGYLRDGDWNIAMKWLGDNGLKNNPDEKTYDPDALNWISANDYIEAGEKYITGYTEKRPVVRNGKPTGETKTIKVDGVVTWTPGDVNIAQKKGGLVSIVSTKEYSTQMPCVIIGIDKWMRDNRPTVENFVAGVLEGGDAVKRGGDTALMRAAEISTQVYKEQDAAYWARYFKGTVETDKAGERVELGGSSVNNLKDTLLALGMTPGSNNLFEATYTVFGNIAKQQYPELMKSYYPADQVTDLAYLKAVASRAPAAARQVARADLPKYNVTAATQKRTEISRRAWNIQFATGQASFTPAAARQLEQLRRDLLIAGNTVVEIHGHTDNVGNPQKNMDLSEARAFAVQQWLQKKSSVNFPANRLRVYAHGPTNPVAPNASEAGRARNRRVEIVLLGNAGA